MMPPSNRGSTKGAVWGVNQPLEPSNALSARETSIIDTNHLRCPRLQHTSIFTIFISWFKPQQPLHITQDIIHYGRITRNQDVRATPLPDLPGLRLH